MASRGRSYDAPSGVGLVLTRGNEAAPRLFCGPAGTRTEVTCETVWRGLPFTLAEGVAFSKPRTRAGAARRALASGDHLRTSPFWPARHQTRRRSSRQRGSAPDRPAFTSCQPPTTRCRRATRRFGFRLQTAVAPTGRSDTPRGHESAPRTGAPKQPEPIPRAPPERAIESTTEANGKDVRMGHHWLELPRAAVALVRNDIVTGRVVLVRRGVAFAGCSMIGRGSGGDGFSRSPPPKKISDVAQARPDRW